MSSKSFLERSDELEILDDPNAAGKDIHASLRFMVGINRYLGGTRVVLEFFEKNLNSLENFTVLDLGTGSGDIPQAIVHWAKLKQKNVHVTALDVNPHCLEFAKTHFNSKQIQYLNHSAFELNRLGMFDYITTSMFFHHLKDDQVIQLMKIMSRHCRRGFIINDLYRCQTAYYGVAFLGLLSLKKMVYNDGKLSVKRGFREPDFEKYKLSTGLKRLKFERRPVYRVSMSYHV